ncbi:failed axon connections homolog [Saccostrea echinata]|uniref:failed axon connections homolog n=1 Tax=Saccostrea echinata TaxID=191078 RepID=UPI002A825498|nr:failed axon connections homolog [Saccostrea echinata]
MEVIQNFVKTHSKEIGVAAAVGISLVIVIKRRKKRAKRVYPPNTVVHHQMGRGAYAPSLSPFCLKLETYLRMAKVPFMNVHDSITNRSSKGKVTWIEYNGEEVADSEFCIQFINQKFNVDLDKDFSEEDQAAALAIQRMVDEHLFWTVALQRWVYDPTDGIDPRKTLNFSWFTCHMINKLIKRQTYAQGVGRHTKEEVHHVMDEDLQALSKFLGKKKFLLGEKTCQADSAVFGMLAQMYFNGCGGYGEKAIKKYPNLCEYCERMKETFWPDWDDCITHGWTKEATK